MNTNNLVEPVAPGLDLQPQEPFLLYRNSRNNIHGIWFYEKEECIRIACMLRKLLKECEETRSVNNNEPVDKIKKTSGSNVNDVDIFSMLSKAQKDFNTSRNIEGGTIIRSNSPPNNVSGPLAVPLGPDVTSQSVMDFFAKAKVNIILFTFGYNSE